MEVKNVLHWLASPEYKVGVASEYHSKGITGKADSLNLTSLAGRSKGIRVVIRITSSPLQHAALSHSSVAEDLCLWCLLLSQRGLGCVARTIAQVL